MYGRNFLVESLHVSSLHGSELHVRSDARLFPQDNITNIVNVFDDLSQWISFDEFNEDVPHCDLYEEFITTNVPYPREIDVHNDVFRLV